MIPRVHPSSNSSIDLHSVGGSYASGKSPSRGQLNRYPSLSAISKAEIPRAVFIQNAEPDAHEYDDQTIESYLSTPIRNQNLMMDASGTNRSSDDVSVYTENRRGSAGGLLPKLGSQPSLSRMTSHPELLPAMGSRRNLLRHDSQNFDMVQDVTPDKKWSVKRDCFLEKESSYNEVLEVAYDETGCRNFLTSHKWPVGVQNMLLKNIRKIPLRIFICDDSGSMLTSDGKRLHGEGQSTKALTCTRWAELSESLRFHLSLSREAILPSEFRLLNGAAPVLVGIDHKDHKPQESKDPKDAVSNMQRLLDAFEESPSGQTPLCWHIRDVIKNLEPIADRLRLASQKVAIIIATDGEPTDGDLVETLRPLQQLPVWLIVRLCTDDERIVNFWNNVDTQLELDMDVIDDLFREAEGVAAANKWLTYSEPLHRLREFGITVKEFDLLDESLLTGDQIRSVTSMIFDKRLEEVPHPDVNPKGFVEFVSAIVRTIPPVWDPMTKTVQPWLNLKEMKTMYRVSSGCVIL